MAFPLPSTLSPSKVSVFTDCAMAFRFSAIDRVPEPPSLAATRGTLVHAALERLMLGEPASRTRGEASHCLADALRALRAYPDLADLGLDAEGEASLSAEGERLLDGYFALEDPSTVRPIGIELMLRAEVGGVQLRGIIDRLELDAEGSLVVTDYKTGRAPGVQHEQKRLSGVAFYSLLCERLLGRRPSTIRLMHLAEPVTITTAPTERSSRGVEQRVRAIWTAVERACRAEDFRPKPSHRCEWCAFRAWCPAWGGDPGRAPRPAPVEVTAAAG